MVQGTPNTFLAASRSSGNTNTAHLGPFSPFGEASAVVPMGSQFWSPCPSSLRPLVNIFDWMRTHRTQICRPTDASVCQTGEIYPLCLWLFFELLSRGTISLRVVLRLATAFAMSKVRNICTAISRIWNYSEKEIRPPFSPRNWIKFGIC